MITFEARITTASAAIAAGDERHQPEAPDRVDGVGQDDVVAARR